MDTDHETYLDMMAQVSLESPYTNEELKKIFMKEVFPACRVNLYDITPDWAGWDMKFLAKRIFKKHRHGKLGLILDRKHALECWDKIERAINELKTK